MCKIWPPHRCVFLIGVFAGLFYTVLSRVINMELNPLLLDDMDALFLNSRRRKR